MGYDEFRGVDDMGYSIKEMADLSGVTSRTLRYYEEIGLLKPHRHRDSGYRIYGEKEVDSLQQILFYRTMDLTLDQIKKILADPDFEISKALKDHHQQLIQKRNQLDQLILTVEKTMAYNKGEINMANKEKFEGFKKEKITENESKYGDEIQEKYGKETIDESNRKYMNLSEKDYEKMLKTEEELFDGLKEVMMTQDLDSIEAKKVFDKHKAWLNYTWPTYSKEAHLGLAQMYLADERFGEYYHKRAGKGAVEILVKIIERQAK